MADLLFRKVLQSFFLEQSPGCVVAPVFRATTASVVSTRARKKTNNEPNDEDE